MSLSEQPSGSPEASRDFNIRTGGATGGLGWWWHTTDDTPDKIDPAVLERDCKIYLGIVHALCTAPVLPLDYEATAKEWLAKLQSVRAAAGKHVDLAPTIAAARRLVAATQYLARAAKAPRVAANRKSIAGVNQGLMALGRALIPIGYTQTGRFDHDAALEQHDVPLLAAVRGLETATGDAAKHLAVRAVRDLNALRAALTAAADVAEAAARAATTLGRPARGPRRAVGKRASSPRRAVRKRR
jgi:hypothetical protein